MGAASFYRRAFAAQRGARGFSPAWPLPSSALAVAPWPPSLVRVGRPELGGLLRRGHRLLHRGRGSAGRQLPADRPDEAQQLPRHRDDCLLG